MSVIYPIDSPSTVSFICEESDKVTLLAPSTFPTHDDLFKCTSSVFSISFICEELDKDTLFVFSIFVTCEELDISMSCTTFSIFLTLPFP